MSCRTCKKDFIPTKEEKRCSLCLAKRKANRLQKKGESRKTENRFKSIESLIKSNGSHARAKESRTRFL